jgi:hypothetical protein
MTKRQKQRNKYLIKKYGIGLLDYKIMFDTQKGVCALCGRPPKPGKNLHVEHSHKTGKVRALVDYYCNKYIIGRHSLATATKLYEYMVKYDG